MSTLNVLIVDDEVDLVNELVEVMQSVGIRSTGEYSGEGALEAAKKEEFDVVVTDMMMPGMDGLELIQAIEKLGRPNIRYIVISGHLDMGGDPLAVGDGIACTVFAKPVNTVALIRAIENVA